MFAIPVSTLRYYDKEGLFSNLMRARGKRQFDEDELELLRIIDCLKKTGLEIKDIKKFVAMAQEGPSSYAARKELFVVRRTQAEEEIARLQKALAMVSSSAGTTKLRFTTEAKIVSRQCCATACRKASKSSTTRRILKVIQGGVSNLHILSRRFL